MNLNTPENEETGVAGELSPEATSATQALVPNTNPADELPQWTPDQQAFLDWLAQPAPRHPQTQKAFAELLGVSEFTLSRWRSLPGFSAATLELKRTFVRTDDVLQVIDAMLRAAIAGDVPAAKLVMQYVGLFDPEAPADERYQQMTLKIDGEVITVQLRQGQGS